MPQADGNSTVPPVCEALMLGLMQSGEDEPMTFCFYPADNTHAHIGEHVIADFKKTFPDTDYQVKIGNEVNIWELP